MRSSRVLFVVIFVVVVMSVAFGLVWWIAQGGQDTPASGSSGASPSPSGPTPSVAAHETDAAALLHEAIANVRLMERFRFEQRGPAATTSASARPIQGEVDLSEGPSDPPRFRVVSSVVSSVSPSPVEQVVIGRTSYIKVSEREGFRKGEEPIPVSNGRSAGPTAGAAMVTVVDPLMRILEPLDRLPARALGIPTPSADGLVSISVTATSSGSTASYTVTIDRSQHLVREVVFTSAASQIIFTLRDFADTTIRIETPRTA